MAGRIFLVGDQAFDGAELRASLVAKGHSVVPARASDIDVQRLGPRDVVLAAGPDGVETCEALQRRDPKCSVIVLDGAPDMRRAIAALRAGAADFVTNPEDAGAVDAAIHRVLEKRVLSERLGYLGTLAEETDPVSQELLGESIAMRQVRARLQRLRGSDTTVLITGENGTGKEAVARILHDQSPRRDRPFVAVSSANAPDLSNQPPGSTVFLDDVERLSDGEQAALERTLEERARRLSGESAFDARIIAATSVDLENEVAAGRFREGLLARLKVVQIHLPSLRERGLDALVLAQHFVRRFATVSGKRVVGMTLGAARALMEHDWPGNVRELGNCVEAAVLQAEHDHITESELPARAGKPGGPPSGASDDALVSWNSLEARHIASILEEAGGNKARAARLLGIDRKTLYRKLERYGLDAPDRLRRAH